jgi:hypothetical protein
MCSLDLKVTVLNSQVFCSGQAGVRSIIKKFNNFYRTMEPPPRQLHSLSAFIE